MTTCPEQVFKGYWHMGIAMLFASTAAYNVMRVIATRHPRNVVNIALYAGLALYEIDQAKSHWCTASAPRDVAA